MEFLSKLEETLQSLDYKASFHRLFSQFGSYEATGFRQFEHIKIDDNIGLSIQASSGRYCSPRKTIDLDKYETMEFAIVTSAGLVNAKEVTKNDKLIEKLGEYFDGSVYGFVPVELIEELYQDLISQEVTK